MTHILECFAQKRYIVAGSALSACLAEDDSDLVHIDFAAFLPLLEVGDDLSQRNDGRITCVIIDVSQTFIDCVLIYRRQSLGIVSFTSKGCLEELEVDR